MILRQVASKLTHTPRSRFFSSRDMSKVIDELNQMVNVSSKATIYRMAIASCRVILDRKVFDLVSANQMEKGDVLSVAKIAGICGAKQTSNLIPLCHNINLTRVYLDLKLNPRDVSVEIEGQVISDVRTGVVMEAMTAVTVAGGNCYYGCKARIQKCMSGEYMVEEGVIKPELESCFFRWNLS